MKHFAMRRMSEVFHIEKGRIGIKAATPGNYPLVTTGESFQTHEEAHFHGDAVCIPMISSSGHGDASIKRLHHIQGEFAVGSILCVCTAKDEAEVSARYVYYYLTARKDNILVPLMQGSANVSLKLSDIASVEIPLPPMAQQLAVVARLDNLAGKVKQVSAHLDSVEADADQLLAQTFSDVIANATYRPMGDVAPLVRRQVVIDPESNYTELGVRSFYKGTFHRRTVKGSEFTWQKMFRVELGDLVFSNIMAWEKAIALATAEDHGCLGNHRMLSCVANREVMCPEFLAYYFTTEAGFSDIYAASPGTAARNRTLIASNLAAIEVPVPTLSAQQTFAQLHTTVSDLKKKHLILRELNEAVVPATLDKTFSTG